MDPEAELAQLIQLGHNITSLKLCATGSTALLVYDYLLTLEDEVRYAWKTENFLMLALFLFSRYLPLAFQTWILITATLPYPGYTSEMYECNKTAFVEVLYYTVILALSQIVMTRRSYAITGKKRWIAGILYTIFAVQFTLGIYMTIRAAVKPAPTLSILPSSYRLCAPNVQDAFMISQMFFSLAFDVAVFALAIIQNRVAKSINRGMGRPSILDTVSRDAGIYFGLITVSHFLVLVMYLAARPGIGRITLVGTAVFIPMMICRVIMSLKKAATSQRLHMSVELQTGPLAVNLRDTHTPHVACSIQHSVSVLRKD